MNAKSEAVLERLYNFISDYQIANGMSPTTKEMLEGIGAKSKDYINRYVSELDRRGVITKNNLSGRNIDMIVSVRYDDFTTSKLIGSISCGLPAQESENNSGADILLPKELFGEGELYILTANGDSMINAGIEQGDKLVVRKTISAKSGDIVVALVDDHENTLKRYVKDGDTIKLVAENDKYADIYPETLQVQGVLAYCIKAYE